MLPCLQAFHMLACYLAFRGLFSIVFILVAVWGSSGDRRLSVVRRCTNTKKGLSPCHKQSEVSECHFAGVGTGEQWDQGQEDFNNAEIWTDFCKESWARVSRSPLGRSQVKITSSSKRRAMIALEPLQVMLGVQDGASGRWDSLCAAGQPTGATWPPCPC